MSDNIRFVPFEIREHRYLKLLWHTTRMAALAPTPTIKDFRNNEEAETAELTVETDVEYRLTEHGLLGAALEYRAAAEAVVRWTNYE
jgi:hypothetical protein